MRAVNKLEKTVLRLVRLNANKPRSGSVRREWAIAGYRVRYEHGSPRNAWGRFGGGWNWNVGVQVGGSTVIVNLLVASLRIDRRRS
jgi:hypothetical protein